MTDLGEERAAVQGSVPSELMLPPGKHNIKPKSYIYTQCCVLNKISSAIKVTLDELERVEGGSFSY